MAQLTSEQGVPREQVSKECRCVARQVLNHVKGSGVSLSDAFPSLMLITTRLSSYVKCDITLCRHYFTLHSVATLCQGTIM